MNKHSISFYIRIQNLRRTIFPIIILLFSLLFIKYSAIPTYIFPEEMDSITEITDSSETDTPIVSVMLNDLTFTGFTKSSFFGTEGGYYYFFEDNKYHFVVLKPVSEANPYPEKIDSFALTGRITNNAPDHSELVNSLSDELDWTTTDFLPLTSPYMIDETGYHPVLSFVITFCILLLLSVCMANVIVLMLGIIFPFISLATFNQTNILGLPKLLRTAEAEFKQDVINCDGNMYITENYFINASSSQVYIVPLDQIVWAYYHSILNSRNILFKHTIYYALRLVTDKKRIISIPGKQKAHCIDVLDVISTRYPEILIGYTDENHLDFLYQFKRFMGSNKSDNSVST